MDCKMCQSVIEPAMKSVQYIKKDWKCAGKYAGSPEYVEEIVLDSGLFCSDGCLIDYLRTYMDA